MPKAIGVLGKLDACAISRTHFFTTPKRSTKLTQDCGYKAVWLDS